MKNKIIRLKNKISLIMVSIFVLTIMTVSGYALDDTTAPKIISSSIVNNELDVSINEQVTVLFSEDMDPATINNNTFKIIQRTTPSSGEYRSRAVSGIVSYNDRYATFKPYERLAPDQVYGNVFTIIITSEAKDLAGNGLSENYIWSFTTGEDIFNTGASTSQQNQTVSSVVAPITPLTQIPNVGTPAQNANSTAIVYNWFWIIAIAIGILLVVLVIILSTRPTKQKTINITSKPIRASTRKISPSKFSGYVYPVKDIEGIGPKYSDVLISMGIKNTKQLWEADVVKIAQKTGASLSQVNSWQNMAELASVKDIGPQYAELLERSGIHSIDQLKNYDSDKLLKLVLMKQESLKINIQGNNPGQVMVEHWIDSARDHNSSYEGQKAQT